MMSLNTLSPQQEQIDKPIPEAIDIVYRAIIIVAALAASIAAIYYWAIMTGISHQGEFAFDKVSPQWRTLYVSYAILLPVTALAVWFETFFGIFCWGLLAMTHFVSHVLFQDWFGINYFAVGATMLVFIVYGMMEIVMFIIRSRRMQEAS